jgi:hypothetical protein
VNSEQHAVADRQRITSEADLPLVCGVSDVAALLDYSERTIERLDRAGKLPPKLIDGEHRPRWARETLLQWISGGSPRRGRR